MYSNLASLNAAILAEMGRTGDTVLTARLPDLVKMGERRIYNGDESIGTAPLRCREMETRGTLTFADGVSATPAAFLEAKRLTWETDRPSKLKYTVPDEFYTSIYRTPPNTLAFPLIFTIEGTVIDIAPKASGTATLSYYARPSDLSVTDTNSVLTTHGHIYFLSTLIDAYAYVRNALKRDETVSRYAGALAGVNNAAVRARYAGTHLAPRIPGA